jgi:hypothetical protein
VLPYAYHFEFCERPGLPEWLRGDLFSTLAWVQDSFGLGRVLAGEAAKCVASSGARRVIELGSGSGDGLRRLASGLPGGIEVVATDIFPRPAEWRERLAGVPGARWIETPVSFDDFETRIGKDELAGAVVLFVAAFHHVPKDKAGEMLKRLASHHSHVLIVEPLGRDLKGLILGALCGIPTLIYPLLARGVSLARRLRLVLFHICLPVIPLFLCHDGAVSAFRQRRRRDWEELLKGTPYDLVDRPSLGWLRNFSVTMLVHRGQNAPGAV